MQEDAGGATLRYTILGHVVRGGRPSYSDRLIGSRLGYTAAWAAMNGESQKMVGWRADEEGGQKTDDPRVQLFELPFVLSETTRLLDGTHPTTQARLKMISAVQGVLPL